MTTVFAGEVDTSPKGSMIDGLGGITKNGDTNSIMVEAAPSRNVPVPPRPDGLPEKFKSVADLAKSYSELERRQGAGQNAPPAPVTPPPAAPNAAPATGDALLAVPKPGEAPKTAPEAGAPTAQAAIATASEFFAANGKLDDGQYAALAAAGIPKEVVENFVQTHTQAQQATEAFVYGQFSGPEGYQAALAQAKSSLTPAEMAAFDSAMKSRDFGRVSMAVNFLKHKTGGGTADLLDPTGHRGNNTDDAPYGPGEQEAAMRDPRYERDEGYRNTVEKRVRAGLRRRR